MRVESIAYADAGRESTLSIAIERKTRTAENITQRYMIVSYPQKVDALTRILEVENFEGMIIFVRTKQATEVLAERLRARGFSAAAINGDIAQAQRERTINQLRDGRLDILVATDVAARGLDVERISHVVNYDIPTDTESYVHRIGRTGRAGRTGDAEARWAELLDRANEWKEDNFVARASNNLGVLANTLVILSSDNGYMWGEHGLWGKDKTYEESARVPLVVVMPGVAPRVETRLVTPMLDIGPTLFQLAGISRKTDGASLVPLLGGDTVSLPEGSRRVFGLTAVGAASGVVPARSGARRTMQAC